MWREFLDRFVTPADEVAHMKAQRAIVRRMTEALSGVSPGVRRVLAEESGAGLDEIVDEARRVLG